MEKILCRLPVSVVCYRGVGHSRANSGQRTDRRENLTCQIAQGEARVKRIVYENWGLHHHRKIANRKIHDEHVRGSPQ